MSGFILQTPHMLCLKPVGSLKIWEQFHNGSSSMWSYVFMIPDQCFVLLPFRPSIWIWMQLCFRHKRPSNSRSPQHATNHWKSLSSQLVFAVQLATTICLRNSWQSSSFCHLPCLFCNVRALSVLEELSAWGEQSPTAETFKCHKMSQHQISFKILKRD